MTTPETGNAVLAEARKWLGTPYRHQSSVRGVGCDCLGLIRGVWRSLYGSEPEAMTPYTSDWGETAGREEMLAAANRHFIPVTHTLPGDLIVFRWRPRAVAKHAGIVSDDGRFIHSYEASGVVETILGPHWTKRIAGRFRFPPIET
jgi:NlpC/P60 family putative phage cell wall peptidase